MPRHRQILTKDFSPKAWGAICTYFFTEIVLLYLYIIPSYSSIAELLGGEDRIDPTLFESCGDSLIVNLGSEQWASDVRRVLILLL